MNHLPYGFRLVGAPNGERRLVNWQAAFAAHACCDQQAALDHESYLSAFTFGEDFAARAPDRGIIDTRGFSGPCWAPFIWWDLDAKDDFGRALNDARGLASMLLDRYPALDAGDLLLFFSGSKGFHTGLPTFWGPTPSDTFNRVARCFAEALAVAAGVSIDTGVYDKVRLFRTPNSRHPKTGLHKRRLSFDELLNLSADRIRQLASKPEPFDLPAVKATCDQAATDWQAALQAVEHEGEEKAQRRNAVMNGAPRLNRATLKFIRNGADQGDRHRLLYSCAANLAEFNCPPVLAHALLTESALDSGLTPKDVRRQIECGLSDGMNAGTVAPGPETSSSAAEMLPANPPSTPGHQAIGAALAELWARQALTPSISEPDADDNAELNAEREAIQAEAGRPAPPCPPPDAWLFFQDDRGRACDPGAAFMWTWSGAPRWFSVADFPIP